MADADRSEENSVPYFIHSTSLTHCRDVADHVMLMKKRNGQRSEDAWAFRMQGRYISVSCLPRRKIMR